MLAGAERMRIHRGEWIAPAPSETQNTTSIYDEYDGFERFTMQARYSHSLYTNLWFTLCAFAMPFITLIIFKTARRFVPCTYYVS